MKGTVVKQEDYCPTTLTDPEMVEAARDDVHAGIFRPERLKSIRDNVAGGLLVAAILIPFEGVGDDYAAEVFICVENEHKELVCRKEYRAEIPHYELSPDAWPWDIPPP